MENIVNRVGSFCYVTVQIALLSGQSIRPWLIKTAGINQGRRDQPRPLLSTEVAAALAAWTGEYSVRLASMTNAI